VFQNTNGYRQFHSFHPRKLQTQNLSPYQIFIPPMSQQPLVGGAFSLSKLKDYTQTHHTRYDSSGRVISLTQRPHLTTYNTLKRQISVPRRDSNPQSQQASGDRPTP